MTQKLSPQKGPRATKSMEGFTLIELLVVVAVLGLLASIAIPQAWEYRQRSFDARAESDLHSAAQAEEAYFQTNENYATCRDADECQLILPGYEASEGIDLAMNQGTPASGSSDYFTGRAFHPKGSRNRLALAYLWNSATGGMDSN